MYLEVVFFQRTGMSFPVELALAIALVVVLGPGVGIGGLFE